MLMILFSISWEKYFVIPGRLFLFAIIIYGIIFDLPNG